MARYATKRKKLEQLPDPNRMFGGALITDDAVSMAIAHADSTGTVRPMRSRSVRIAVAADAHPALPQIEEAMTECWADLFGPDATFRRFFLCVPPWSIRDVRASTRVALDEDAKRLSVPHTRPVRPRHLRQAARALCAAHTPDGFVPVNVLPEATLLDGRLVSGNPVGLPARTLEFRARLIVAEAELTRGILDILRSLGVRVDSLTSPPAAAADYVTPEDRQAGAAVADVGTRATTLALHSASGPGPVFRLDFGSDHILAGTASRLGVPASYLAAFLTERRERQAPLLGIPKATHATAAARTVGPFSLFELNLAARIPARRFVQLLSEALESAGREHGMAVRRIMLAGDDELTLRSLEKAVAARTGISCACVRPAGDAEPPVVLPGCSRMLAMFRQGLADTSGFQPFLGSYNESAIGGFRRVVRETASTAYDWVAARLPMPTLPAPTDGIPASTREAFRPLHSVSQWFF